MLVVTKNGKEYGPLVNLSELAELLKVSRDEVRIIRLNNQAIFENARKTKQKYSLDILDKTWMNSITEPFWRENIEEQQSESIQRFERGLKKCG